MKAILFAGMMAFAAAVSVEAKVWIVDSNPGNSARDFTTLSTAEASASVLAGDTLYMIGSSISYGACTFDKKLIIIGPGYFLGNNPNTQANNQTAATNNLIFTTGSQGSILMGLDITSYVQISTDNITVRRCAIRGNSGSYLITLNGSNLVLIQNYMTNASSGTPVVVVGASESGIIITNNFIDGTNGLAISMSGASGATIRNNVLLDGATIRSGAVFENNIMATATGVFTNVDNIIPLNNLGYNNQFGTAGGNLNTSTGVFTGTGSSDGMWQLAGGSPALLSGVGGVDMGMFGAGSPYVLSGIPTIPTIYYFTGAATGSTSQGLPVTIKVKSRN